MDYKKLDLPNTNYPNQEQLKAFEIAFNAFLETNPQENENHHNDAFNDLLKGVFEYKVKPTKKIDSAILNENNEVEVIIEFKALKNPNEFVKGGDLNVKALHESLLYYLIERKEGNNNLKRLILGTIKELYIIDANEFEIFNKDKEIQKAFENCHDKKGNDPRTKAFYDACQKRLNELDRSLKYHHIPLKKENLALIYQALSPNFLLKIPKYSDANTLNKDFYEELLYILGLEEQNEKGKILIKPSRTQNSLSYALKEQYKNLDDEEVMALLIAWNNRILFLRLLESLLISFNHFENPFLTTENFKDFNALNTLFFEVLAKKNSERSLKKEDKILEKIPYLNSSLFDKTPLELKGHEIRLLENKKLELYQNSVLKKHEEYQKQKDKDWTLLEYLFAFLHVYDFTTTPKDIKDNQNNSESRLINPSVLGLVFEKLNGYKEGSFYTPSFITSYMCKESIESIVLDKFNQTYNIECEKLTELKNYFKNSYKEDKRKEYLNTLLTLRICDPAVGSGHFLVSALNEMVLIAYKLGLIASLPLDATLKLENDEILIKISNKPFIYTCPTEQNQSHQIQKELFNLKKDIIENCLFGVDINPNSCEITKLRLWIELLKYSYYIFEEGKNTNNLETLPNIDINIKCANSLISRFNLNDDLKKIPNIKKKIQEYKDLVAQYKDPNPLYPLNKQDLINKIQDLKNTFSLTLKDPKTKAELEKAIEKHITKYNDFALDDKSLLTGLNYFIPSLFGTPKLSPKEEEEAFASYGRIRALRKKLDDALSGGEYHNAFEWRFEFPEVLDDEGNFLGFDCIIGNPPYINTRELSKNNSVTKEKYRQIYREVSGSYDIFILFILMGLQLQKVSNFAWIIPNKFTSTEYGRPIFEKLKSENKIKSIVDVSYIKTFESASVYPILLIGQNNSVYSEYYIESQDDLSDNNLKKRTLSIAKSCFITMAQYGLKFQSGTTGFEAQKIFSYIKSGYQQDSIPFAVSGSVDKYVCDTSRVPYMRKCFKYPHISIKVPVAKTKIDFWINEKIVIAGMTKVIEAYYTKTPLALGVGIYAIYDFCGINPLLILGVLNSNFMSWYARENFKDKHMSGGYLGLNKGNLEKLPMFELTKSNKPTADKITALVDKILQAKAKDPKTNTQELEKEIDALVYQLYHLTDEEIKIIENGQ
ncbi:type IIS restriction-modification protein [Helicobacter pylori Hp A-5]|uniref:type IIG restriction enzyme/methyltransferase n=1 Tax=Helicobacter pylori TaxID=210 RepID=UPI00026A1FAF|nr:Eco57I restriction-modification methylase domain-containing protein [Helicobacter pylori]EJB41827.1 type IIS restriction-modification protein [Helicobacter pylori Hp A-5]